jgi:hypothetical protein
MRTRLQGGAPERHSGGPVSITGVRTKSPGYLDGVGSGQAGDPCKIAASGSIPDDSTNSFPIVQRQDTRLLTGQSWFESTSGSQLCRRRLAVRTPGSQPGNRGFKSRRRYQCARSKIGQSATLRKWTVEVRVFPCAPNQQGIGEPGRPCLPWKEEIDGSNPSALTRMRLF